MASHQSSKELSLHTAKTRAKNKLAYTILDTIKKKKVKRLLLDKKIGLELVPAYALASNHSELQVPPTKSPAKAGQLKSGKNTINLAWRGLLLNARTFFEQF